MSRIYDALRRAEAQRVQSDPGPARDPAAAPRTFRAVTVVSNKGGVGKTTFATNLAVQLRSMRPELPVLLVGLDDELWIERMFGLDARDAGRDIVDVLREGRLEGAIREGRHGVHWVAPSRKSAALKTELNDLSHLERVLRRSGWRGVVVIDTKSDLEILTQNALAASDLAVVVVKDQASLLEAERVFDALASWDRPIERARILLSLVDLRVKFREGEDRDVLALLVSEIRRRGWPLFETFLSRSPKAEALATNPSGRPVAVREGAPGSLVDRQLRQLAGDVLTALGEPAAPARSRASRLWRLGRSA